MGAGWGNRYHHYGHETKDSSCKTGFANKSPHKIAFCSDWWTVKGEEYSNCTNVDIPINDLAKPCRLLTQERMFQNKLNKKHPTLDDLVRNTDAPIKLEIKMAGGKMKTHYCGITKFQTGDTGKGKILENCWCATKLD